MTFYLWKIGCQYNDFDAARFSYALKKLGFKEVIAQKAKIIIIIACAVRQTAVDRIFGRIKNWKNKKIIVTGCVLEADKKKLAKKGVKFGDIEKIEDLIKLIAPSRADKISSLMNEGCQASVYVPIMVGCNNFCSYCAVPLTRGREKSRSYNNIIKDVKTLIKNGHKEIMLLGQNVNSYKYGFAKLLCALNDLPGDFIISFTSNHPKDMTDEIIEVVAKLPKIKKEIHLPVQSGSNKILKAMNRPYTIEQYLKIVEKIRQVNPKIKITTDVIVGFPGETEKDFQKTVEVFKRVGFSTAYINKYSPRAGTAAYKLGDPISWDEKKRRWKILDQIANKKLSS